MFVARFWSWLEQKELGEEELRTAKSVGIDVHQAIKWLTLILLLSWGVTSSWAFYLVAYLIAGNLFTYFYYHTWGSGFRRAPDVEARRRRFEAFILSVAFYLFAYAYLYQFHLADSIGWPSDGVSFANALYGSVTTAFTLTYGDFTPLSSAARTVVITELLNTFVFLSVILTDAIPRIEDNK